MIPLNAGGMKAKKSKGMKPGVENSQELFWFALSSKTLAGAGEDCFRGLFFRG
jgi:hypothetical protein